MIRDFVLAPKVKAQDAMARLRNRKTKKLDRIEDLNLLTEKEDLVILSCAGPLIYYGKNDEKVTLLGPNRNNPYKECALFEIPLDRITTERGGITVKEDNPYKYRVSIPLNYERRISLERTGLLM